MTSQFVVEFESSNLMISDNHIKVVQLVFSSGVVDENLLMINKLAIPPNFSRMVTRRRNEYLAGRICAQKAIKQLLPNILPNGLLPMIDRAPDWPLGVIGSISHNYSTATAAACVAKDSVYKNIGIDIETIMCKQTCDLIIKSLLSLDERKNCSYFYMNFSFETMITLIFSAKESLFKALYRDVGFSFGFDAVKVTDMNNKNIRFVLQQDLAKIWKKGDIVDVSYRCIDQQVYTWLVVK